MRNARQIKLTGTKLWEFQVSATNDRYLIDVNEGKPYFEGWFSS